MARQSVNVDAIVFWLVWNAEKSILEVADFIEAITLNAHRAERLDRRPRTGAGEHFGHR